MKRPANTGYTAEERAEISKLMMVNHDTVADGLVNREEDAEKWQVEWDKSFDAVNAVIAKTRTVVNSRSKDEAISNAERFFENLNQFGSVYLSLFREHKFAVGEHTWNVTQQVTKTESGKGCTVLVSSRKRTGVFE